MITKTNASTQIITKQLRMQEQQQNTTTSTHTQYTIRDAQYTIQIQMQKRKQHNGSNCKNHYKNKYQHTKHITTNSNAKNKNWQM